MHGAARDEGGRSSRDLVSEQTAGFSDAVGKAMGSGQRRRGLLEGIDPNDDEGANLRRLTLIGKTINRRVGVEKKSANSGDNSNCCRSSRWWQTSEWILPEEKASKSDAICHC